MSAAEALQAVFDPSANADKRMEGGLLLWRFILDVHELRGGLS
jgi:hypothetical protein